MPAQRLQYRDVGDVVSLIAFAVYFNKPSHLPSFIIELLWHNLLAATADFGQHLVLTCEEVLGQARTPGPHRRSALNNIIAC